MIKNYYWEVNPKISNILENYLDPQTKFIVEIGPFERPLKYATEYIDIKRFSNYLNDKKVRLLDISKEKLPYKDKEVDFLYARHILEDLYNPTEILFEIERVSKSGYLETPSPIAECCRFVNGKDSYFRGYSHHKYIIWMNKSNVLNILPKLPLIEYLTFNDQFLFELLNSGHKYWNTYCFYCDAFPQINYIPCDQDIFVFQNYQNILNVAIKESFEHTNNQLLLNPPTVEE